MGTFPTSSHAESQRRETFRGRAMAGLRALNPVHLQGQAFAGRLTVERVLFAAANGGFHLLLVTGETLRALGVGEIALACRGGSGFDLLPGMRLDVEGAFAASRDRTVLEPRRLTRVAPSEDFGLEAWLRSAGIKGVGRLRAAAIAEALGADWRGGMLDPARMASCGRVPHSVAEAIATRWQEDLAANEVRTVLLGYGLSAAQRRPCWTTTAGRTRSRRCARTPGSWRAWCRASASKRRIWCPARSVSGRMTHAACARAAPRRWKRCSRAPEARG
jgi:hypothetical protein